MTSSYFPRYRFSTTSPSPNGWVKETLARRLVTSFGSLRCQDRLLPSPSELVCFLLGIDECVAGRPSGIKPFQKSIRLSGPSFRERNDRVIVWSRPLCGKCHKGRVQNGPVRIENPHNVTVIRVSQFEQIRTCWKYTAWELDGLIESEFGAQVPFVSVSSDFEKQNRRNDEAY
jgi:hypothetical protein